MKIRAISENIDKNFLRWKIWDCCYVNLVLTNTLVHILLFIVELYWSGSESESDVAWNGLLLFYAAYLLWSESEIGLQSILERCC